MKTGFIPDSSLTEEEYLERHQPNLADVPEADDYLRKRYQWMKGKHSYIPVQEAFKAYEERVAARTQTKK